MMRDLTKSDVDGLEFQQRGVLVNTDNVEYEGYIRRRNAMRAKDAVVQDLQGKVAQLTDKLEQVLSALNISKPE